MLLSAPTSGSIAFGNLNLTSLNSMRRTLQGFFSVDIASGVYSLNQPTDTQLSFRNLFHQVDLHSFVRFSDLDDFFVEHFNVVSKRFILSLNNSLQGRIHLELLINVVKCEITCLHSFSQELMHSLPKLMCIVMVSFRSVITMSHM